MAMKRLLILITCLVLLCSHELFLKTDRYFLGPYQESELYLYNGTFDRSANPITRDRIVRAEILGPSYTFIPSAADYYDRDSVTYLRFKTGKPGTYIAGISLRPNSLEMTEDEFTEYLMHEGLEDIQVEREKKGIISTVVREQYAKHVKAIFQVSGKRSGEYKRELGYIVEFIPINNPYSKKTGEKLSLKLMKQGKPLPNHVVHYSCKPSATGETLPETSVRTDAHGFFTMVISKPGKWYASTIDMVESTDSRFDYISNWATLTFEVK
jgi:hypothetical protein